LLELLQIFRDDENRSEYHVEIFCAPTQLKKVILIHATTVKS